MMGMVEGACRAGPGSGLQERRVPYRGEVLSLVCGLARLPGGVFKHCCGIGERLDMDGPF